jgi:hypothetical protein
MTCPSLFPGHPDNQKRPMRGSLAQLMALSKTLMLVKAVNQAAEVGRTSKRLA